VVGVCRDRDAVSVLVLVGVVSGGWLSESGRGGRDCRLRPRRVRLKLSYLKEKKIVILIKVLHCYEIHWQTFRVCFVLFVCMFWEGGRQHVLTSTNAKRF